MRSNLSSVLIFSIALTAGCAQPAPAPPPPPPPPDAVAIRAALDAEVQKFLPAMQKKDAAAVSAMFTDDATWILPDATTFTGRAEIEKGAKGFFDSYESVTPGTVTIDKLVVISDSEALTFSHGSLGMTMKGKKMENHINPFADYWKKGPDGVWRIAYEVNADGVVPDAKAKRP